MRNGSNVLLNVSLRNEGMLVGVQEGVSVGVEGGSHPALDDPPVH